MSRWRERRLDKLLPALSAKERAILCSQGSPAGDRAHAKSRNRFKVQWFTLTNLCILLGNPLALYNPYLLNGEAESGGLTRSRFEPGAGGGHR